MKKNNEGFFRLERRNLRELMKMISQDIQDQLEGHEVLPRTKLNYAVQIEFTENSITLNNIPSSDIINSINNTSTGIPLGNI